MSKALELTVEPGDPAVVRAVGEVDFATAARLRQEVLAQVAAGDTTLDLAGVTFFDSQGISVLVAADRLARVAGTRFVVRGAQGMTLKALTVLGLDKVLMLEPA